MFRINKLWPFSVLHGFSETLASTYEFTQHRNPKDERRQIQPFVSIQDWIRISCASNCLYEVLFREVTRAPWINFPATVDLYKDLYPILSASIVHSKWGHPVHNSMFFSADPQ